MCVLHSDKILEAKLNPEALTQTIRCKKVHLRVKKTTTGNQSNKQKKSDKKQAGESEVQEVRWGSKQAGQAKQNTGSLNARLIHKTHSQRLAD